MSEFENKFVNYAIDPDCPTDELQSCIFRILPNKVITIKFS